jgi:hypothetical protein
MESDEEEYLHKLTEKNSVPSEAPQVNYDSNAEKLAKTVKAAKEKAEKDA